MDNKKFGLFLFISLLVIVLLLFLIGSNLKTSNNSNGTTEPVIKLKGARYIEISKGTNYVEPGYVAIDQKDGDISSKVVVEGKVNTRKEGLYDLIYKVTNSSDKTASVTREVEVIDDEGNINFYLLGDENMTVIKGDKYVEEGALAIDTEDGNITKKIKIKSNVDTSKLGKYTVKYTITNSRGTTKTLVRNVEVVDEEVTFDYDIKYKGRSSIITINITGSGYDHLLLPNKLITNKRNIAYEVYEDGNYEFILVTSSDKVITKEISVMSNQNDYIYAERIDFSVDEVNLKVGDVYRISFETTPSETNDIFDWSSSNSEVASVSYGEVEAKKEGSAVITVKTSNNVSNSLVVNVKGNTKIQKITLDKHNLSMHVGDKYLYVVNIEPSVMNPEIEWSSSDESVAVIDNGVLTAVGTGYATIKASIGGVSDYSYIEVNQNHSVVYYPESITLDTTSLTLKVGEERTIKATIYPNNAINSSITWSSGNNNIVTVNNGKIKAVGVGTAEVSARTLNGKYSTATIKVIKSSSSTSPSPVEDIGKLEIHMIFASNGLATVIRSKNKVIMVDAGECCENPTLISKISNYISDLGVKKIDAIFSTHTDTDHNSAMCEINSKTPFKTLYSMTDNWKRRECVKSKNKKVKLGDKLDFGDFKVEVVGPVTLSNNCINKGKCDNTDSMNIIITFGKDKFLFTGDYVQSDKLINKWGSSKFNNITFVQQPHHGQHDYISGELIKIMKPSVVFVPAGRNFLSSKMKGYYNSVGAKIYNTCNKGNLVAVSDGSGKALKIYTEAKAKDFKR